MTESERIHVNVSVAVVTDRNKQVLLTFNDDWGMFSLPMAGRRQTERGKEPATRAAIRAAAEALGVPVRLVDKDQGPKRVLARLESGRQLKDKVYSYDVYHAEPHPDFDDRLQIRQPFLWLSPHLVLSGTVDPISESARFILREVLPEFEIPARIEHTSILIIKRQVTHRGIQFLVRRNPHWGFALPAKRWEPPGSAQPDGLPALAAAAGERVAREELGLEMGTDLTFLPARPGELTTHGVSMTREAPAYAAETQYIHSLFDATLRQPEKLRSDRALAWVTAEEIHQGWTAGSHPAPGSSSDRGGRISRTVYDILHALDDIPDIDPPEVVEEAVKLSRRIEARLRATSPKGKP
jgi:hypothetical protein